MRKDNTKDKIGMIHLETGEILPLYADIQPLHRKVKLPKCFFIFANGVTDLLKLSGAAISLYIELCNRMGKGNHVYLSQRQIAKIRGISQAGISRQMTELKRINFIRGSGSHYMINPDAALQGGSKIYEEAHKQYELLLCE